MDPFSYLTVLISIILGLGITHLLGGLGRVLQARGHVRPYGPSIAWLVLLLVIHVQTWWALFGLRAFQRWSFLAFVVVLLQPIVLYLLAALVVPAESAGAVIDLRENYYAQARSFFGLTVLLLVVSLTRDLVIAGHLPGPLNLTVHGLFFVAWGTAAFTQREWYHRGLVVYTAVLMVGYIATLFRYLPQ